MGMSNGMCHLCKTDTETLCHSFYHCRVSYCLILKVESTVNALVTEILCHYSHKDTVETYNVVKFENHRISENRLFENFRSKLISCSQFLERAFVANIHRPLIENLKRF